VLLVDDDELPRKATQRGLTRAGYTVLALSSGEEAIDAMRSGQRFDVILTDFHMPGLHGREMIKAIRALDPHVPIVFLTGSLNAESQAALSKDGAFDCLQKPVDNELLIQVVRDAVLESDKWKVA
jgi:CheY-like chemotaxis protein